MSEDIYAKPDLSKKGRFQTGEKKDKEDEEEERGKEDVCDNIDNVVIYDNCWTEESTPPDNITDDQQKTTSVSQSEDIYAKPELSKKVRFQMSEKKEEEDEERRNADIYHYVNNVMTAVDPGPLKRTLPRAAGLFLGLLCLVLLAAVIVLLVLWIQDQNNWNTQRKHLTRERDELQTNYSLLTAENNNLTTERDELQTNYSLLTAENNNLATERDELQKQLETHYCPDYWISFGKSCYLISNKNQPTEIPMKNWSGSKKFCEDRGAHLVIISNEEEQNLWGIVKRKMDWDYKCVHKYLQEFVNSFNLRVWIGLTDEETEGVWKWVDGTQVTKTYWGINQPDNPPPGEDCAEIFHAVKNSPLKTWNDMRCRFPSYFICEKMLQ